MEQFGPTPISDTRWRFVAWAPAVADLALVIRGTECQLTPMTRFCCGFHVAEADADAGTKYLFRLPDGRELPDPASRFQPVGVHGASAVVDAREFRWTDSNFQGHALSDLVIYEFHVGTFTSEGTFAAATRRLAKLVDLGITAVEIMPVAQFPGPRNWGYDGVYPFAAQNSYGGPAGLQQFVDAAHAFGISVILDVVYNHLGPEGNYLGAFGPFFTERYHTPWGEAINYDDAQCAPVREFFIQNAIYWLEELHIDGLRLDAVHGIFDFSAHHFLAELKERVQALAERTGRTLHVIAESDLNDARLLHSPDRGGYGLDAQWSDDFHHSVHTLLTGESSGYYADFGSLENLHTVLRDGWLYAGQYSPFRQRAHGNSALGIPPEHFVVCSQNHDQVGNRPAGDRLSQLVDFESLKLAAGITLLSPFVPLLFMGEEYGETHPFQYFTSHSDAALIEAVRKGRRDEFAAFGWQCDIPDPQDEETFRRSTLDPAVSDAEPHRTILLLYKKLISIRKQFALGSRRPETSCNQASQALWLKYGGAPGSTVIAFHFGAEAARIRLPFESGLHRPLLDSSKPKISEAGRRDAEPLQADFLFGPRSFVIFDSKRSGENQ